MAHLDRRDTRFGFGVKTSHKNEGSGRDREGTHHWSRNTGVTKQVTSSSPSIPPHNESTARREPFEVRKNYLPQKQDPWKQYKPLLHVLQGCSSILAQSIPPSEQLYAVRKVASEHKETHLHAVQKLGLHSGQRTQHVQEIFDWSSELFIVTGYIRPSLSQIITSEVRPTESQIAFIAYAVSAPLDFYRRMMRAKRTRY